jgi:hypothetical protein
MARTRVGHGDVCLIPPAHHTAGSPEVAAQRVEPYVSLFAVATLGVALAVVGGLRVANGATAGVITGYGGECADVTADSTR